MGQMLVALVLCLLVGQSVVATRLRVGPAQEDPSTEQVYNDLRHILAHPNYYFLHQAGIPVPEKETSKALLRGNTLQDQREFVSNHFKFNSSEFIRRFQTHKWFWTIDERIALHVYDDPKEMELATGPQVNQELCGVHLDYMLHMMRKHHNHITDTTDLSMFKLMNSFDLPHRGLAEGNSIFQGSYDTCVNFQMGLIKRELIEMLAGDKRLADQYLTLTTSLPNDEHKVLTISNLLSRIYKFASQNLLYIKPFFGYFVDDSILYKPIDVKSKNKLDTVAMRYCMAGLRWPSWSNSSWHRRHMVLRVATCIPDSCDSSSLRLYRNKLVQLIEHQMTDYYSQFYIENFYCLPDESSDLRNPFHFLGTQLFIGFLSLWFLLSFLASVLNSRHASGSNQSMWRVYLRSWCLQKNLRDFFAKTQSKTNQQLRTTNASEQSIKLNTSAEETTAVLKKHDDSGQQELPANTSQTPVASGESRLNFAPLEGLKVIGSIGVMTSHAVMLLSTANWAPILVESFWHSWLSSIATVSPAMVDVFFVITGVLTFRSIASLASEHRLTATFWLKYIVYRYLRIVPLYLLIHLFMQHLFRFIGLGPFWDYGSSHSAWCYACQQDSVWRVLLPSANLISPSVHCNGVGWYLANDLQFTLLVPLILPLLLKRPRLGQLLIGIACLLGTLAHVHYFWLNDPDARGLFEWTSLVLNRITDDNIAGYTHPQYRFVAYLIGLSLGQLLDSYEKGLIRQWPSWLVAGGKWYFYTIVYLLFMLPFISSLVLDWDETKLKLLSAIINGTAHSSASLAIAAFLLALTTGHYNPQVTNLLSARFFKLVASMSFSTLLVHLPLMFYHQQTIRALPFVTKYDIVKTMFVWELEAFALSFLVHILFEVPLRRFLIKLMLALLSESKKNSSSKPSKEKSGGKKAKVI